MSGFFDTKEQSFEELVYRGVESDELDYKARMSWNTMSRAAKGKLVRHLVAFANTRGGYLVIGVGEDQFGNPNLHTGVTPAEAGSFDPSAVGNFVNSHVEPPINFTIERPTVRGKKYVIFVIHPFTALPHVCSNSIEGEIQSGVFYIRTVEASSRPARRAIEMQELIRRALRNERDTLAAVLRNVLYENGAPSATDSRIMCSDAIEESEHYFRRRTASFNLPQIKLTAEPSRFVPGTFNTGALRQAFFKALHPEIRFLHEEEAEALPTPGSLRYISIEKCRMWQFFDSGLFCFFAVIREKSLAFDDIVHLAAVAVDFFSNLYTALNWQDELITLRLEIVNPNQIEMNDGSNSHKFTVSLPCRAEISRNAAELANDLELHATRLACKIGEAFHISSGKLEKIPEDVRQYLEHK